MTNTDREPVAWRWRPSAEVTAPFPPPPFWSYGATASAGAPPGYYEIEPLYAAPPPTAPTAPEGEPFMWGAEWEGGCGRMFREAYRTEEDARRDAEHLNGRAFPLFRHAASAPTVEAIAAVIRDECFDNRDGELVGSNEAAARIIELFQGKA